jgi:hypothetical protein
MSYDLYFTGKNISKSHFVEYFIDRANYEVSDDRASAYYFNKDTGVYFSFDYADEDNALEVEDGAETSYFASFNQNYYRPHFFGLEAEPEITTFVHSFGCSIFDPQPNGMDDSTYTPTGFIQAWNYGNKNAYEIILDIRTSEVIYSRPTAELEAIWRWNYSLDRIYQSLEMDIFVPRIVFLTVDGTLKTACIWSDDIPTLTPMTDIVYAVRGNDSCIIAQSALDNVLPNLDSSFPLSARNPGSTSLPAHVKNFIQQLPPHNSEVLRVEMDKVLNAEYIEEHKK